MSEVGFHDAGVEYYDDFPPDDAYDRFVAECEGLGVDPFSPLAPYYLDDARWDFDPEPLPNKDDFLPDFDPDDIPF